MSDDLMLHGVLNMPVSDDPTECDLVTWVQFKARAREASARIEALTAKLAEAETNLKTVLDRETATTARYDAKLAELEATITMLKDLDAISVDAVNNLTARAEAAEARERDAYERGFKAALEKAAKVADNMSEIREDEQTSFIDDTAGHEADFGHKIADAIRAIPLPDTKGDDDETK